MLTISANDTDYYKHYILLRYLLIQFQKLLLKFQTVENLKLLLVIIVIQVISSLITLLGAGSLEVGTAGGVTLQPGHDTVEIAAATVGLVGLLTGLDEDDGREAGPIDGVDGGVVLGTVHLCDNKLVLETDVGNLFGDLHVLRV